jgi:hypothetical protein
MLSSKGTSYRNLDNKYFAVFITAIRPNKAKILV